MTKKTRYLHGRFGRGPRGGAVHRPGGVLRRWVPDGLRLDRSDRAGLRARRRHSRGLRRCPGIMDSELRQQLKTALPTAREGQEEFQDQTGIDIERDIDYVIAAMNPAPGRRQVRAGRRPRPVRRGPARRARARARRHGRRIPRQAPGHPRGPGPGTARRNPRVRRHPPSPAHQHDRRLPRTRPPGRRREQRGQARHRRPADAHRASPPTTR